ncbi:MAG: T9SS type A sorting domain-containing protein [Bacteroidales bacterium]
MTKNCIGLLFGCAVFGLVFHSFGQTVWTKYQNNPVLVKGPDNFDLIAIGQPTALFENDTLKMWYAGVGLDYRSRICYCWSTDGIVWNKHSEPVMDVGSPGEWDQGWLDTPAIVKDNEGYKLYYYGDTIQQSSAISSAIGMAASPDGIHWVKYAGNPIFTKGNTGDWDGTWVESPTLLFDSLNHMYTMWYNGVDTFTWKIQIGMATSGDGINWTKYPNNPVIATSNWGGYDDVWLGTPSVVKRGSTFELWYAATSTNSYNPVTEKFDTVSICYASSTDGISWIKSPYNPLFNTFSPPYDSLIDEGGPWAPAVVFNNSTSEYMLWFEAHGYDYNYTFSLATAPENINNLLVYHSSAPSFTVYPNPFNRMANILIANDLNTMEIDIYNSLGQNVTSHFSIHKQGKTITHTSSGTGLYFLRISNGACSESIRVLVGE